MDLKYNVVGWFEIPVTDMDRAIKFYETVFGYKMDLKPEENGMQMAWFPMDEPDAEGEKYGAGGALVKHEMSQPSATGTVVYFNANSGDLANELGKVEAAGGKVLKDKMDIGEHGFIGIFMDTEGNTVAIHSM